MTTKPRGRSPRAPRPTTLRRLYVTEDRSQADLAVRYQVGGPTVRQWLIEAGIPIRPRRAGGLRRQLQAPTRSELTTLARQELSVPQIADRLGVSKTTARRWFDETGATPPRTSLKNRRRGTNQAMPPPTRRELRQLYVGSGLSITAIADRIATSPHLVRTWLHDYKIPVRPAGGRIGATRNLPPRKPSPPVDELRQLRERDRLSRRELAQRYQVHPGTVSRWLTAAGLPTRLPPAGPTVSDAELAQRYEHEEISAAELARLVGLSTGRVLSALHRAEVTIDPNRQSAAVRAAATARRGTVPALPAAQGERAAALYRDDGWSYARVADALEVSIGRVRGELHHRGIPARTHQITGLASRASRAAAPIEEVRRLYVDSQWTAAEVAAKLHLASPVVLRTGHAHGLPIRQGGRPAVSTTVALIEDLYSDQEVSTILARHAVPRRPPGGDIAQRFPDPVPLTIELLDDLYTIAGCSSNQIEVLTGQPQAVVRRALHRYGIPFRAGHLSPALIRMRAAAREQLLTDVVNVYRENGSTRRIAEQYECAPETVRRWLAMAGVAVPGRGRWTRQHTRR